MLITFQSPATPDVVMLRDLAQYLLGLVGKRLDTRGVILHDELPHAISRLEAAISDDEKSGDCPRIAAVFPRTPSGIRQWTFAACLAISRHDARSLQTGRRHHLGAVGAGLSPESMPRRLLKDAGMNRWIARSLFAAALVMCGFCASTWAGAQPGAHSQDGG